MPSLEGRSYDVVGSLLLGLGVFAGSQRQERGIFSSRLERHRQLEEANGS